MYLFLVALVIFGGGHKEILDDLIRDRGGWDWKPGAWLLGETD